MSYDGVDIVICDRERLLVELIKQLAKKSEQPLRKLVAQCPKIYLHRKKVFNK